MTPAASDMRLWALSDLHIGYERNREVLAELSPRPYDWIILAGDIGESLDHMRWTLDLFQERYARVLWVPGNHELWTTREAGELLGGADKYAALVELCRGRDVLTPEDPYPVWPGDGGAHRIALMALLFDYSFAPPGLDARGAVAWAAEGGVVATDEFRLDPSPHPDIPAWCAERLRLTEARLTAAADGLPAVLVNHWPLREDLIHIPRVPRYLPWCGTRATHDWHRRWRASVVVTGHLHTRRTDWIDGVRFEEVSLGYPRQHRPGVPSELWVRQILPEPPPVTRAPDRYIGARPGA